MMLAAARAQAPHTLEPADALYADQDWIDEEFFRIIRRSFPARTATDAIALPAGTAVPADPTGHFPVIRTHDRSAGRARERSPPASETCEP